ncbi:GAF domain-containing protein [Roseobacter sp. GAI101]|uniref:GAF domain-containing protein n=1 Tax=Roseobacter sp. (strain GAI101) TaxID=391589 RepID=UPI0001872018|nr:GAF domain-containing protein [Roseobacter sp. GAI101]EEB85944.1 hypothetical protein RGAI101_3099 [Roseobacter sp. GAI101]
MKTIEHVTGYLDSLSLSVKTLRLVALVVGVGMSAVGYYFRGSEHPILSENADTIWLVGLSMLLLANLVLVFVDKQSVELLKSLHAKETEVEATEQTVSELSHDNTTLTAWLALTKLLSELTDQAMAADTVDRETTIRLYKAAVEFIAEYKGRLFGFNDDYANIAIYEFDQSRGELVCVACYRTRPSDAEVEHRSWKPGEGHVGKAYELQTELVCSDARVPDVSAWISAPPEKFREEDTNRYVSLAAIPIALEAERPLGVVIMTSSEPYRFVNFQQVDDDPLMQRAKYSVAALQDIAAQIAQLMFILRSKRNNQEGETDDK